MSNGSAAVIAKARAKYGKMLKASDYHSLTVKSSIGDIVRTLKDYPDFKEEFHAVSDNAVHRGQVEEIMSKRIFNIYRRLVKFMPGHKCDFYYFPIKMQEMRQIMNSLMYISAGVYDKMMLSYPSFLREHSTLDAAAIVRAKSFGELLSALDGTPYKALLMPLARGGDMPEIRDAERELGNYYYEWQLDAIKREFSGNERAELEKCVLRYCDYFNIKVCYRLKGLFGMPNEEVLKYILPFHGRFNKAAINELLSRSDSEPMLPLIKKLPYFRRTVKNDPETDFEMLIKKSTQEHYRHVLRMSPYTSVVLYALFELFSIENSNLTCVIEGVRYSLAPAEIEELLLI